MTTRPGERNENDTAFTGGTPYSAKSKILMQRASSMTTAKCVIYVAVLFFINLLNYMDRFTISGVLEDLQKYFDVGDAEGGLLQTVFLIFFMVFAPISGFLGDRYNRKIIMVVGLLIWILAVLASSFVPQGPGMFYVFAALRGAVGIGEASYSTVAPTIIADLFVLDLRSRILMLFYFAIPFGSGFGFIFGSMVANYFDKDWRMGVRVTPPFGILALLALIFFIRDPERGLAEREYCAAAMDANHNSSNSGQRRLNGDVAVEMRDGRVQIADTTTSVGTLRTANESSYLEDLVYLVKRRSYVWMVIGYTTMVFVVGTVSWWVVKMVQNEAAAQRGLSSLKELKDGTDTTISMTFGVITCAAGFIGVTVGVLLAQAWKRGAFCFRPSQKADAYVSAIGSLAALPLMCASLYLFDKFIYPAWFFLFLAILSLCMNWAIVVDMLMYTIVPWRRNVANSVMILISHMCGDATGPLIIGLITDWLRGGDNLPSVQYHAFVHAFYGTSLLLLVSGVAFLLAAYNVPADICAFENDTGMKAPDQLAAAQMGDVVRQEISERMQRILI